MKKISDTYIFLLLFVLAVGLFLLVYFVPLKSTNEEISSLKAENSTLTAEISELQVYHDNRTQYETDDEVLKKEITNQLQVYPSKYREEDFIMEAVAIEKAAPVISYDSINMGDANLLTSISADTLKNCGLTEYEHDIEFMNREVDYNNKINYPSLKDAIQEIFNSNYKLNVKEIAYSLDENTGYLDGVIKLGYYYVYGNGREYEAGTTNIFTGGKVMVIEDQAEE